MPMPVRIHPLAQIHRTARAVLALYPMARVHAFLFLGIAARVVYRASRQGFYNILWAVVFGFATLNILSLAARRFEPTRRGLTFGELMAVSVVVMSVLLLGWELLTLFHVFPLRIRH